LFHCLLKPPFYDLFRLSARDEKTETQLKLAKLMTASDFARASSRSAFYPCKAVGFRLSSHSRKENDSHDNIKKEKNNPDKQH